MGVRFLFFLMLPISLAAQNRKTSSNPFNLPLKIYDLNAEVLAPGSVRLPFSSIKVIDSRFDTSAIGFKPSSWGNSFKRIGFKGGIAASIERYYNEYYAGAFDSGNVTLLIVLKRYWFSEFEYELNKQPGNNLHEQIFRKAYCKWEYYLGREGMYLPVKRIDTVIQLDHDLRKYIQEDFEENKQAFVKFTLKFLVEMLDFDKGIRALDQQPKKTLDEIHAYNASRFNIPVLKDSNLAVGVFLNFGEFKNNKPGVSHFRENKMKYNLGSEERYIEDSGGRQINPYWGYFDGEQIRIGKFGNNAMYRGGNSYFFFVKYISYYNTSTSGNVQGYPSTFGYRMQKQRMIPFQVDMETGEIY